MKNVCGVIHTVLESAVKMWECFSAAAETHVLAKVIPSLRAEGTVVAHDAGLDGDALSNDKVLHTRTDGCNNTSCLVAEDEWCLKRKVPVSTVEVVVNLTE